MCFEGKLDVGKTEWAILALKEQLNEFLTNSNSIEFSQAIATLTAPKEEAS